MRRKLLVGSLVSLGLLLSAPTAGADPTDDAFIEVLDMGDIPYASPEAAVAAGQQVCSMLDTTELQFPTGGHEIFQAAVKYISEETGMSLPDTGYVVGASIGAYCPDNQYMIGTESAVTTRVGGGLR